MAAAAAAAEAVEGGEAPAKGSKKKLILIAAPVLLLLLAGGGLWASGLLGKLLGGGDKPATEQSDTHATPPADSHGAKPADAHGAKPADAHGAKPPSNGHASPATPSGGHGAPAPAAGGHGAATTPRVPGGPVFVDIPDIITNLNAGQRRAVYIKLKVRIELARAEDEAAVRAVMPRVLDLFQTYLREMRPEELRGSAATYRLREELLARTNIAVAPARVQDVLFAEMLIQ